MKTISTFATAAVTVITLTLSMSAAEARQGNNNLVVVDADRGRVVYDDGRDDGACIIRRAFAGYDWYGRPIFRKVVRCF
jgi:glyoxylase-like metal-dependent hydrolase (beta-lactamase superfamily II)